MNTINFIDPSKSDIRFTNMIFPDGQPHIKIDVESLTTLDHAAPVRIFTRLSSANDRELFSRDCKLFSCNLFFNFIKLSHFNFKPSALMSDCDLFSYDCIFFSYDCELFSRDCNCFSCYCFNFNCPTYTH